MLPIAFYASATYDLFDVIGMSIRATYANGVFKPLEKVMSAAPGRVCQLF